MSLQNKLGARKTTQSLKKHREFLVESLRNHLLPVFLYQGFALVPQLKHSSVDRKSAGTFPFERLQRARPDGGVDQIDIQLMTYGRPAFRINACAVPSAGMMTIGGHCTTEECLAQGIHDLEMYACPRWLKFFSLWLYRFRSPTQTEYDKLALRVAHFVPELESALRGGQLGPHMRRLVFLTKAPDTEDLTRPVA